MQPNKYTSVAFVDGAIPMAPMKANYIVLYIQSP